MDEIQQAREYGEVKLAEGSVKAKVGAVLAVLEARGISVSTEARVHIEACKDVSTLDRWIVRAATATSAEEVIVPRA